MKYNTSSIPSPESGTLPFVLVGIATLIGGFVRLAAPLAADFPLNDGGLFYAMIETLHASHFVLPVNFFYNGTFIPFSYPPLGFYLTDLVAALTHQPILDVMRWLPPLISTITIPAFYLLSRHLLPSQNGAALATFAFAFLPRAFSWLIMGGGVTRSLGFLFAILTLACAYQLFTAPHPRLIIWTSLWSALTVLTHPEAAAQTAFAAILFLLFFDRTRSGFLHACTTGGLTLLLTAPWWTLMLARYGLEPFLAAAQATGDDRSDLINLVLRFVLPFRFEFAEEALLPIISVFGLLGLFSALGKRNWFLPVWLVSAHLFEPRSAPLFMTIPLAMLAAHTLSDIILPYLNSGSKRIIPAFLGLLLAYVFTSASLVPSNIAGNISLQPADRETMNWIKENTPNDSVFIVLTGQLPLRDPVSEWFPILTARISAATVFGCEWIKEPSFASRVEDYNSLQACLYSDSNCLLSWENQSNIEFTFILIRKSPSSTPLQINLDSDGNYSLVFQTPEISIYEKKITP